MSTGDGYKGSRGDFCITITIADERVGVQVKL